MTIGRHSGDPSVTTRWEETCGSRAIHYVTTAIGRHYCTGVTTREGSSGPADPADNANGDLRHEGSPRVLPTGPNSHRGASSS